MADTRGIRAGRAFVELGVSDKLAAGLKRAAARLKAFGEGVRSVGLRTAAIGAAILAPLLGSAKVFADTGSALFDMSQRTGISVEALSELGFAAEQSGTDLATLETGIRKMQRSITDAAQGSTSAQEALALLGLTVDRLRGLSPEDQFKLIADRIAQIKDPTVRAAAAMELFGRSGTNLIPLLSGGAKGIEALQEQARRLGLTMSTEDARAAEEFGDVLDALTKVVKRLFFAVGSALAPMLMEFAESATRIVVRTSAWIQQNKQVIVTVFKVAAAVLAAGAALIGLGLLITGIGAAFGLLASVAAGVGTAIGVIGSVIAALLSPIGLVVVAVAGLGAALLVSTGAGGEALTWLSDQFSRLRDRVSKAIGGIADALAAGDIGLAAQILWLTLKLIWQQGVASLNGVWLSARNFFVTTAQKMWFGAVAAAQIGFHALEVAWIETTAFLSKTWTKFSTGFQKVWETATSFVAKRMLEIQGVFDSSLDVEAAKEAVDQQLESRLSELDQGAQRDLAASEAKRQREREQSAELNEATLAEIGRQFEEAQQGLKSGTDEQVAETQRQLEEARRKLDEAIAEAKRKREEAESEPGAPSRTPADLMSELDDQISSLGDLLARGKGASVQGTFNAAAAQGLAASAGMAERTAKATEQTAKNTKRLVDAATTGGLAFT
ncbi:MAG: phage tail tape measure protein [Phycisphaerales bacterium]|nr:phage tail tape measure protein [Phycisphaerales bacterium]